MGDEERCRAASSWGRQLLFADRGDRRGGGELCETHPQSGYRGELTNWYQPQSQSRCRTVISRSDLFKVNITNGFSFIYLPWKRHRICQISPIEPWKKNESYCVELPILCTFVWYKIHFSYYILFYTSVTLYVVPPPYTTPTYSIARSAHCARAAAWLI